MKVYNKLIRDKIPHIIESIGKQVEIKVLDNKGYVEMLDVKLQEELEEYIAADDKDQVEELADLVEVIYAILEHRGVSIEDFEKVRLAKKEERGGFEDRLLLIGVEDGKTKDDIFNQFNPKEELMARKIDDYITKTSSLEQITIKKPITDCIGYKIAESDKFVTITTKKRHSLIFHVGEKHEQLGIKLQQDIDMNLGQTYPRSKTDNEVYPHEAYAKLEWIADLEQVRLMINIAYNLRTQESVQYE